jgi:hypothetical protein
MTRTDVLRDIEAHLFEVLSLEPLRRDERYVVQQQLPDMDGHLAYLVIGGKGTQARLLSRKAIPHQPFLIMRRGRSRDGSTQAYEAITLSALADIVQRLEA